MSPESRHSHHQAPARHDSRHCVLLAVVDRDSRSGWPGLHVTSDNAFASRQRRRRKAAGIKQCLTKSATNCKEAAGIPERKPLQKTPIHLLRGGLDASLRHKQKNVSGKRPILSTEEGQLMPQPAVHELLQIYFVLFSSGSSCGAPWRYWLLATESTEFYCKHHWLT